LHRNSFLSSISQEHGIIDADLDLFATTDIGDLVVVLPVHSCLTANLFSEYQTLSGEAIKKFRY
jgi:D-serine deaminase-like pyridoxal phosphate-dependent protein